MSGRARRDQKNEQIARALSKLPHNKKCINCNSPVPQYVCCDFSTFVCMTCSGIHREFTHRVKSISMSKFSPAEVAALHSGGNQVAREIYIKKWDFQKNKLPENSDLENLRKFIKQVYVEKAYAAEEAFARGRTDECGRFSVDRIYVDYNFDASRRSFSSYRDSSLNLNKFKRFPSYVSNKIDGTSTHGWYDMDRDGPRRFSNYSEDDCFERIKSLSSYAEKTRMDPAGENPTGFLNWDGRDDMGKPSNNSCGSIGEIPHVQNFQGNEYGNGLSQGINYIGFGEAGLFNSYCNLNSQNGASVGGFTLHGQHGEKQSLSDGKGDKLHISKSASFAYSESLTGFPSHQCVSVSETRHYVQGIGVESALNNGWATFDLPPSSRNNSSLSNGPAHIYGTKEPIDGKTESISKPTFCAREGSVNVESDNQCSNSSFSQTPVQQCWNAFASCSSYGGQEIQSETSNSILYSDDSPSIVSTSVPQPFQQQLWNPFPATAFGELEAHMYTSEWEADFSSMPEYRNQDEVSVSSIDPPHKSRNPFDSPEDYVPVPIDFPIARFYHDGPIQLFWGVKELLLPYASSQGNQNKAVETMGPLAPPLDGLASLSLSSSSQTKVPISEELKSRNPFD
ncbi:probable ADP-ribosylation factor GTPase-activating protein AGD14 [Amborella trichopoda]|uniref:probable ADP-ribosylation factor GTPase-activating protein AGD14 n=1 Tax=Amborella trichopoda TaxID=13333 RepID=UPI0009C0F356|nr:probable ADP-ribosylation factor GTPase-activating protein AGD14 [Amborella trichopoda]|eukprot:XP_020517344.1 probable ADP-ribosylation factor GTPase-activating protein AGD14 [Amborella trichopoda]